MVPKKERLHSFTNVLKFISGIISWTILVILVIVAGFLLYYFISVRVYAQKGENFKPAFSLYTILSPSMEPNINVYDVIFDINVDSPEDIKEGDVITFISTATLTEGMTITHRVVQVIQDQNGYSYMTKGDNNLANDGAAVPFENVLGKVLFRIPQLGRVQEFLATKGGWLIIVVIPALLVIISDVLKIFRLQTSKNQVEDYELKEKKRKQEEQEKKAKIKEKLLEKYEDKKEPTELDKEPQVTATPILLENTEEKELKESDILPIEENVSIKNIPDKEPLEITKQEMPKKKKMEPEEIREKTEESDLQQDSIIPIANEKQKEIRNLELPKLKTEVKKKTPQKNFNKKKKKRK